MCTFIRQNNIKSEIVVDSLSPNNVIFIDQGGCDVNFYFCSGRFFLVTASLSPISTRAVTVHVFVLNRFGTGCSVRYGGVPNEFPYGHIK